MTETISKAERRRRRKAGELRDWASDGTRTRTAAQERRHALRMHRWARWYDRLNGAPEGPGDR